MKNTYYFSHDTNANRDDKILSMRVDYGWEGYGWYWAIVETMAETSNYKLKFKDSNPNRVAIAGLSLCHNIPIEKLEKFIDDCINKYGLFTADKEYFWSKTLLKRLLMRDEKTSKLRDAGIKGAEKRWGSDSHPNGEATNHPNGNKRKLKEIKLKENIKEVVNQPFQETQKKKKKANKIEYDFEAQCWYGLDDDILESWAKKFPMLNIAFELQDKLRGKFRLKPKYYQKMIKEKYKDNFAIFIFDWLEGSKKFYLQDNPDYEKNIGRNVNHIGNVMKDLNIKGR